MFAGCCTVAAPIPLAAPVIRATLSFMRMLRAPFSSEPKADDASHDQGNGDHAYHGCGITEHQDADHEGASRADPRPYRVGGAHGNETLCPQKQRAAHRHGDDGENDPPRPRAIVGPAELQPERPAD